MKSMRTMLSSAAVICATGVVGLPANAQTPDQTASPTTASGSGTVDEVVVTAERRESTAQRVPAEITVLNADTLARQQITDITGLQAALPSTQIYPISNNVQIAVRGIGSTFIDPRADPFVATSLNGVFLNRTLPRTLGLLDVARIEALNGPQGTLYGRNAAAGAINIIPNEPSDHFEGSIGVTVGNLDTRNIEGVVNLPLGDTFAVRAAFSHDRSDGYVEDYYGDVNTDYGRLSARWAPNDKLTVLASWDHAEQGGNGNTQIAYPCPGSTPYGLHVPGGQCSFVTGAPFDIPKNGFIDGNTDIGQLHIDYDFGFATLTSITGYVVTANDYRGQNGAIFGSPDPTLAGSFQQNRHKDWTQEVRLASADDASHAGGLAWVVGAFYFDSTGRYELLVPSLGGGTVYPALPQKSEAIFAQGTYGVTDDFRLTAGARYTHDEKGVDTGFGPFSEVDGNNTSWKLGAEYDVGPANMLYASVSTGYVAGGGNGGIPTASPPPFFGQQTYEPMKLTDYEIGSKNRFLDNRLQVNASLYYYDIENYQLFEPGMLVGSPGPVTVIQNINKVTTYGATVDTTFALTPYDRLGASIQLAHGELGDAQLVTFAFDPSVPGFVGVPYPVTDGTRIPNLPDWQVMLNYDHTFAFGNDSSLVFAISSKLSGDYETTVTESGTPVPADNQASFSRTDLSLTYHSPGDRFSIQGWVRNLEDDYVNLYGEGAHLFLYQPLPPRTYGVTLSANF